MIERRLDGNLLGEDIEDSGDLSLPFRLSRRARFRSFRTRRHGARRMGRMRMFEGISFATAPKRPENNRKIKANAGDETTNLI